MKRDCYGNRIARKTKNDLLTDFCEDRRFSGMHSYAFDKDLGPQFAQRRFDEIQVAHRDATREHHHVGFCCGRRNCVACYSKIILHDPAIDDLRSGGLCIAGERVRV